MRFLWAVLSALLLLSLQAPATAASSELCVVSDTAGVWSAPQTTASLIKTKRAGDRIAIVAQSGSWYEVLLGSGGTAWMNANALGPCGSTSGSPTGSQDVLCVTSASTGVWSQASTQSGLIKTKRQGERVTTVRQQGAWYEVALGSGGTAWMTAADLGPCSGPPDAPATIAGLGVPFYGYSAEDLRRIERGVQLVATYTPDRIRTFVASIRSVRNELCEIGDDFACYDSNTRDILFPSKFVHGTYLNSAQELPFDYQAFQAAVTLFGHELEHHFVNVEGYAWNLDACLAEERRATQAEIAVGEAIRRALSGEALRAANLSLRDSRESLQGIHPSCERLSPASQTGDDRVRIRLLALLDDWSAWLDSIGSVPIDRYWDTNCGHGWYWDQLDSLARQTADPRALQLINAWKRQEEARAAWCSGPEDGGVYIGNEALWDVWIVSLDGFYAAWGGFVN